MAEPSRAASDRAAVPLDFMSVAAEARRSRMAAPVLAGETRNGARVVPAAARGSVIRVGHCIHGLDLGGAQKVIKHVVASCDRGSFQHWVYSPTGGLFQEEIEDAGGVVRILPRRLPKLDPLWVIALAAAMRRDKIDVVHAHLFGDSLHGYLAARWAGDVPVVLTLHIGPEGQTALQRNGYRWLLARSRHNVACTESVARSWHALHEGPIEIIPNGIEWRGDVAAEGRSIVDIKASVGLDPGALVIGSIGRLVEQKGLDTLIRAFAELTRSGAERAALVVVGDGPLRGALEKLSRAEGVESRVHFTGARGDVADLIGIFDLVAFASNFEGLPMALLEAMAAGCCVVATDAPGIVDAVTPGSEALIVPRRDVSALSNALRQAVTDAPLRQRLAAAARQKFLRCFTATRMVESYETVYRRVHQGSTPCNAPEMP